MDVPGIQITFDCQDPDRLAGFWAEALRYEEQDPPEGFESWPDFLRGQRHGRDGGAGERHCGS